MRSIARSFACSPRLYSRLSVRLISLSRSLICCCSVSRSNSASSRLSSICMAEPSCSSMMRSLRPRRAQQCGDSAISGGSDLGQLRELSRAVTECVCGNAEPIEQRQLQIRQRRVLRIDEMTATPERACTSTTVSYTHLRAHETPEHLVCRLLL